MVARAIMLAGTGSDVGKSLLVAGLARAYSRRGLKVRPFKPQNMSNNAAVTVEGGEIGRAQALQARAAGVPPTVDMNPILLKPQSDIGSQVVVQGRVLGAMQAREYYASKRRLMGAVLASFERLCEDADLILVEGAGSASEVNLREHDIANFGFAHAAGVPVILVGDINRGGVIASLVGTKAVITAEDAALVSGFIINKFRGDPLLFAKGMKAISEATGWRAMGLVSHFEAARRLPPEDSVALDAHRNIRQSQRPLIVVLCYPRISNFDDFDPLALEPGVELLFLKPGNPIPGSTRLVILPGSKSTIADLEALRSCGWHIDLEAHIRRGGHVLGICGGYQMLGETIADPQGAEGRRGQVEGLGFLGVSTVLEGTKMLTEVSGLAVDYNIPVKGYEMHVGRTAGPDTARPMFRFSDERLDGATAAHNRVRGGYVHGLFANDSYRSKLLQSLDAEASPLAYDELIEATLDQLAEHIELHVDCDELLRLARPPTIMLEA